MITSRTLNQALLFAVSLTCALSAHAATNDSVACTMEAKICPDGVTYVGRQGPNCEFEVCPTESFSDVPSNHPNAEAINYVKAEGIVEGYADGSFKPEQKINRAEFAKILEESIPDAEEGVGLCFNAEDFTTFSDVHSEWFWIYACMQSGRGIVEGYPDGTFRPATNINFVEAAKMLYGANHLDKRGILVTQPPHAEQWYEPYVRYLESQNAIPTSITRFDQPITRGEMAEMIYRLKAGVMSKESKMYEELVSADDLSVLKMKDITAMHPSEWGALIQGKRNIDFPYDSFVFQSLDLRSRHPMGGKELVNFYTRFYDDGANRYEEVCASIRDMCDSMEQSDMLRQKSDLEAQATMRIAGYPAVFKEYYGASSAHVVRSYTFFTTTNRVILQVSYDIADLYFEEYNRREASGQSVSISQLVAEDLGPNHADPYNGLRTIYPNETKGMERFFAQVDAMVASMR